MEAGWAKMQRETRFKSDRGKAGTKRALGQFVRAEAKRFGTNRNV